MTQKRQGGAGYSDFPKRHLIAMNPQFELDLERGRLSDGEKPWLFRSGDGRSKGRPPGTANHMTREIKAALVKAGEIAGDKVAGLVAIHPQGMTSYFAWLAITHPSLYTALIGRVLPQVIEGSGEGGAIEVVYRSAEEMKDELVRRGLPVPEILELPYMSDDEAEAAGVEIDELIQSGKRQQHE